TDAIVDTVPPEYYAGDRALYRVMVESNRERVSADGRISPQAAEITYRNLAAFDATFKGKTIDVAKTYDNRILDRAPGLRARCLGCHHASPTIPGERDDENKHGSNPDHRCRQPAAPGRSLRADAGEDGR